jgi:Spy/CpxP family protein refolding chaperone
MSSNLSAYLILFLVFLLGSLTGAGAMYAYGRRGEERLGDGPRSQARIERRVGALSRQLALSADQVTQVTAILEGQRESRSKLMRETMDRCGEPLRKLRAASDAEIRALLNAEQQQKFDVLLRAHDQRNATP